MTSSDPISLEANILGTLSRELTHEYTRVRRGAVDRASEMLQAGQYPVQVKGLLQTVAFRDSSQSVRDLALQVLEKYKDVVATKPVPRAGQETVEITCSLGHTSKFDKHELYENLGRYWRRSVLINDEPFQELVLACQICGEKAIITLDCGNCN